MNDEQLDGLLKSGSPVPPAIAEKIRAQIQRDTQPVRPMLSGAAYTLFFCVTLAVISIVFAALLSFGGLHALSAGAAAQLLFILMLLAIFAAGTVAKSMRPASGQLRTWLFGSLAFALYESFMVRLLSSYDMDGFVHHGIACLALGVLCGVIVAAPIWIIANRYGFVVEPVLSGGAIGLVGGLAGLVMLTLHCPLLTVPHTGVWHAAVIVICVAAGTILGRVKTDR